MCCFGSIEGLVLPNFARCVMTGLAPTTGKKIGGIDFGFRNPFAAIWGILDSNDVLWLDHEQYNRGRTLSQQLYDLPRDVTWYVDPSGANERTEMRIRNYTVIPGDNEIRPGLNRIRARLEAGKLKVILGTCPNLLKEAQLYRYSDDPAERKAEIPVDEHNHAISALRYLLSRLDRRGLRDDPPPEPAKPKPKPKPWLHWTNDALYTRVWRQGG
jgi:hypothetical protein